MTSRSSFSRLLLDVCREHAFKGRACRVTCIPSRCRSPRSLDCHIESVAESGRMRLRPLNSRELLTVMIRRVRRVEKLRLG